MSSIKNQAAYNRVRRTIDPKGEKDTVLDLDTYGRETIYVSSGRIVESGRVLPFKPQD